MDYLMVFYSLSLEKWILFENILKKYVIYSYSNVILAISFKKSKMIEKLINILKQWQQYNNFINDKHFYRIPNFLM